MPIRAQSSFRTEVGSESPFAELAALRNYAKGIVKPDQKIYLDLPNIHHKLRQMVSYFLYDLELAGDWRDDGYLSGIPRDQQSIPLSSSTYMVTFLDQAELKDTLHRFGNLVFMKTPPYIVRLRSVEGGYDKETDDTGWWYWTSNSIKFHYEIEGAKMPKSTSIRFQYVCGPGRSIMSRLRDRTGQRKWSFTLTEAWVRTFLRSHFPKIVRYHVYLT